MKFEWDSKKEEINIKKHGINFSTAAKVFLERNNVILFDDVHSIYEERYHAIGIVEDVVTVVYTEKYEKIRIISARIATEEEKRLYYEYCRI